MLLKDYSSDRIEELSYENNILKEEIINLKTSVKEREELLTLLIYLLDGRVELNQKEYKEIIGKILDGTAKFNVKIDGDMILLYLDNGEENVE